MEAISIDFLLLLSLQGENWLSTFDRSGRHVGDEGQARLEVCVHLHAKHLP